MKIAIALIIYCLVAICTFITCALGAYQGETSTDPLDWLKRNEVIIGELVFVAILWVVSLPMMLIVSAIRYSLVWLMYKVKESKQK